MYAAEDIIYEADRKIMNFKQHASRITMEYTDLLDEIPYDLVRIMKRTASNERLLKNQMWN